MKSLITFDCVLETVLCWEEHFQKKKGNHPFESGWNCLVTNHPFLRGLAFNENHSEWVGHACSLGLAKRTERSHTKLVLSKTMGSQSNISRRFNTSFIAEEGYQKWTPETQP